MFREDTENDRWKLSSWPYLRAEGLNKNDVFVALTNSTDYKFDYTPQLNRDSAIEKTQNQPENFSV